MSACPGSQRPPAVPLIVHDPYFSVWSFADRLTDDWTRHWTGTHHTSSGILRVDGHPYRYLGLSPRDAQAAEQLSVEVLPTRTIYRFAAGGVELTLTFTTPALPDDLDVLARPLTYLTWEVASVDGRPHTVQLHFDAQADWTVDSAGQRVTWGRHRVGGLSVLRAGAAEQRVLDRSGDNLRIEWGHLYLAALPALGNKDVIGSSETVREGFARTGSLSDDDDMGFPSTVSGLWPVLALAFELGSIASGATATRHALVAYDDLFSIEYLQQRLRPYWRRTGWDAGDLLRAAVRERETLCARCRAFDERLMAELRAAGGGKYAQLCALSYRQALAAHKLVSGADNAPLFFSKENFSNGCIATVDVTYPSAPLFLLLMPELLRGMLTPILDYARSPRWTFPFAPHDLGTYPLANGQVYGGGERSEQDQMPVEECGNMLILVAALTRVDGNADYARRYWPLLTRWAAYLREAGYDPANQLCTDDFAGHLAHNTNLSLKAILGLACYAQLCGCVGETQQAAEYRALAESFAARWVQDADDGDHYRLAFDQPGSWSQKYNLVWDRLLGLDLFPTTVAEKETAYYRAVRNTSNGLPLDNRKTYTKLDWIIWSACLTGKRDDFDALAQPACDWANTTPTRVPLTDWYETTDGRQVGFQARSVVGGLFMRLLQTRGFKPWERIG